MMSKYTNLNLIRSHHGTIARPRYHPKYITRQHSTKQYVSSGVQETSSSILLALKTQIQGLGAAPQIRYFNGRLMRTPLTGSLRRFDESAGQNPVGLSAHPVAPGSHWFPQPAWRALTRSVEQSVRQSDSQEFSKPSAWHIS